MGRMPKRPAFYLDAQICTGCKTCMVACNDKHDLEPGVHWRRVIEYSGGGWLSMPDGTFRQDVFAYYISVSCNHCAEPICVEVCPTTAINQDESGIVTVDQTKCTGCRYCERACLYGAPQYQAGSGLMSKCDFCRDDVRADGVPACVAACPTRALNFGEFDELQQDSGGHEATEPLPDHRLTMPSNVFRPHKRSKRFNSMAGRIAGPEENKDA
jgi:anaerobic dimethyl sulfoxide reductase subunit B (iron-sulfur subunit)